MKVQRCVWGYLLAASSALLLVGCSDPGDEANPHAHEAAALLDQEDEVCGMLVREQSAPRGQVIHRDGSHFFFCSLGDMLVHLGAPSRHGKVEAVFVEVMKSEEDPMQSHRGLHPWLSADEVVYVVGIDRQLIMGKPVLAYADRTTAERVLQGRSAAQILDMEGLREWWKAENR